MQGIIRVETDVLVRTAGEFGQEAVNIGNDTSEMMNLITSMSSSWEGDASQMYITKFRSLEDDIARMIGMIREHSADLQDMAQIYETNNTQNFDDAAALPDDVIF